MDIHELNDLVASSGVNLKDEEDFLNASYRGVRSNARAAGSAVTPQGQTSFDLLSQNNFGNLGAVRSSFQQPEPTMTEEEELYKKHKEAARILSEANQHPLQNPFFWGASLRKRMQTIASENTLQIPITGLWDRIADKPESMSGTSMRDSNGYGIQTTRAPSMLTHGSPLDPMLSILSLAGNERIRSLLEDAYGLARGRQAGSDGVVPPDWSDVATGDKAEQTLITPKSVSGTAWDAVDTSATESENPTASEREVSRRKTEAIATTSFSQNKLNAALMTLSQRDRAAEEARLKLRETRRKRKAQQASNTGTINSPMDSSAPEPVGTPTKTLPPGMLGEKAPEVKMTKKERDKAAKQDISEEVAAREANATATMQIGGKQYSWLNKAKPTNSFTKPASAKPVGAVSVAAPPSKDGLENIKDRKFGTWREDGVGARGVQLRDWIGVLEQDGREKKTLLRAYVKLDGDLNSTPSQPPLPPTTPLGP